MAYYRVSDQESTMTGEKGNCRYQRRCVKGRPGMQYRKNGSRLQPDGLKAYGNCCDGLCKSCKGFGSHLGIIYFQQLCFIIATIPFYLHAAFAAAFIVGIVQVY